MDGKSYAEIFSVSSHCETNGVDAFINEVQRFYCVAPEIVPRTLNTEVTLSNGLRLPAGTTFMVGIWETHHNPYIWKDPEQFNPSRFINAQLKPSQFIPFSAGQRRSRVEQIPLFLFIFADFYYHFLYTNIC